MAMPAQHTEWTVDIVRSLPDDGNRYEVIDGEIFVTPAPSLVPASSFHAGQRPRNITAAIGTPLYHPVCTRGP